MWVRARAASSKETDSSVPAWFRADSGTNLIKQGGNCHRSTAWLGSSVVRVLARYARGPGFESRSGRVLFPPLCQYTYVENKVEKAIHRTKEQSRNNTPAE